MACLAASVARGETVTKPTLVHHPDAPTQHTEPIGLTPTQRAALVAGMEGCVTHGTAKIITGTVKEATGHAVGNARLRATGQAEKTDGHVQKKIGEIEKVFGN